MYIFKAVWWELLQLKYRQDLLWPATTFSIYFSVKPSPPRYCRVDNSSSLEKIKNNQVKNEGGIASRGDSLRVLCNAGFDGGLPQTFLLEVRPVLTRFDVFDQDCSCSCRSGIAGVTSSPTSAWPLGLTSGWTASRRTRPSRWTSTPWTQKAGHNLSD